MSDQPLRKVMTAEELAPFAAGDPVFVTMGETMVREMPADRQRLEKSAQAYLSLAGSELNVAVLLARLGIPSAYVTRVPDNPHGWRLRDEARSHGVNVEHLAWAPSTEPMGRYLYEPGRTPRRTVGWYQRMFSAASRLAPADVDWKAALRACHLFHVSGITFGLARHSGYERNYLQEAFAAAMAARPPGCLVGMDFNYRSTLWSVEECRATLTPILEQHVDILITSIYDMANFFDIDCGRYSASQIRQGELEEVADEDLQAFVRAVSERFDLQVVASTLRQVDTIEQNGWEAMAATCQGAFFRSPAVRTIAVLDRLGGGDAWAAGFYYGLLVEGLSADGLEKGVLIGDAAARIQQTLMFDLPVLTRDEINQLLRADAKGDGLRPSR